MLETNSPQLATVVVRPRFIWGGEGSSVIAGLASMARSGRFMWIDSGRHYPTSSCHVDNVCEGMVLAAERGRGGEIYFLTDGPPVETRSFLTALLRVEGVEPGNRSIPHWLAYGMGRVAEFAWGTFKLNGSPPVTHTNVRLGGEEVTVSDAKARRELGYKGLVSLDEGMAALGASSPSATAAVTA